ncbi:ATP synthase j chain-domain-containing protein [Lentinula guzmanii]|uniref:ATP synthase j chain-domain-containing protein n=3 Tax=Lentinula TaxID=5352 RepID=A0AA38JE95_9AGAR|nr:ATP synthase j chain-domain-containing protein [Lentinula guzmanii]KAJ3749412.1 ATP synthase j chain-domain-containing protein [Lentinula detonsa]KAJ3986219.1 ATP synthase j chain-domain-containing protein [Lentinula detonsa]KAJ3996570.1 ATP synthase j chain-domain-containing protein [Lentinula boryana]
MSFFGYRKWPTPVLRPMWPFMIAGSITVYYVAKIQDMAVRSPEYAKDPKNPYATQIANSSAH